MNQVMEYKGYKGSVNYCSYNYIFYGRIQGIPVSISYEGYDKEDLFKSFKIAVEEYIDFLEEGYQYGHNSKV